MMSYAMGLAAGKKGGGGGASVAVEPLSVIENGQYTAETGKAYSPVVVNVQSGANTVETINGTLADLTGGAGFADLISQIRSNSATAIVTFDASALGAGTATNTVVATDDEDAGITLNGTGPNLNVSYFIEWGHNGFIVMAAMKVGNQEPRDVSAYASRIPTSTVVIKHPIN